LAKKGIVKTSLKATGMEFMAIEPQALLHTIQERQSLSIRSAQYQVEAMQWLLPHLEGLERKDFVRPKVQLFHGNEALKDIYKISLNSKRMCAYFEPWPIDIAHDLRAIDDWHTEERIQRKIPVQIIIPGTHEGQSFAAIEKDLKEVVVIPSSEFPYKDLTLITDTSVLIFSFTDKLGIAIESLQIAKNQQSIFQLVWKGVKQLALQDL
jgi:sugar-specific transcriptional regulator TrmB